MSSRRPRRSRCANCRKGRDQLTEMTEQHGLTPIGNTKRVDSKRVFALMAAPTTLLPSTTTEATMREKRLSKDRTKFGMEMSSQSPHHFSRVNAPVNALTMPTADETWPEGGLRRGRSATHTMSTVEHLYAPIAEHPKLNGASEPSTKRRMRLHCSGAPPRVFSSGQ